jgi:hypothetical protein
VGVIFPAKCLCSAELHGISSKRIVLFIYCLVDDTVCSSDYIVSNGRIINDVLERTWGWGVALCFPGGTGVREDVIQDN